MQGPRDPGEACCPRWGLGWGSWKDCPEGLIPECVLQCSQGRRGLEIMSENSQEQRHGPNRSRSEEGASRDDDGGGYQATEPWKPGRGAGFNQIGGRSEQ